MDTIFAEYFVKFFNFLLTPFCTYVAFLKLVDVVLAHDHETLPGVAQVTDDVEEDAGIGAATADVAGADGHTIF